MNGKLRPVTDADLDDLLRWRNHPRVRKTMINQHCISRAEHRAWWEKIRTDKSYHFYIYQEQNKSMAVVSYFRLDDARKTSWWGFYLCDYSRKKPSEYTSLWNRVEKAAIRHAFQELGLRLLLCETLRNNPAVIFLHKKYGFSESTMPPSTEKADLVVMELKNPNPPPEEKISSSPKRISVAFLGSANWDIAAQNLDSYATNYFSPELQVMPISFGQYQIQLNDEQSSLHRNKIDYWIFCERFEDFFDAHAVFDEDQIEAARSKLEQYIALLEQARSWARGHFLVLDLWPMAAAVETSADTPYSAQGRHAIASDWNQRLQKTVEAMPDSELVDFSSVVSQIGARSADPEKYWRLGRIACSDECAVALSRRLIGWMLALTGATSRLLIVDADNTLWGGIAGENGPGGVQIGGDYPGNQFRAIQSVLAALRRQGFALALCSKNDTQSVLDVFTQRSRDMLLKKNDFSAMRINWRPKPDNIREIAEELNLGLGSVCFIDDNPYEREEVRQTLPQVIVPEMPPDICQWDRFLTTMPNLFVGRLTEEDRNRARQYELRARAREQKTHFANHEDFLVSLNMELHVEPYGESNRQRILQLLAKTNQFNTTTRRHGQKDLEQIADGDNEILALRLKDKFGGNEIIGVVIILYQDDNAVIDDLLLSCRVMGRSIETAALAWIVERMSKRGMQQLRGTVLPTERNRPVRDVFSRHGFQEAGDNTFLLDIRSANLAIPRWFTLKED